MKTYEELIEFCNKNMDRMNISNENDKFLLETSAKYLFSSKFKNWNNQDIIFIVLYLTKQFFEEYKFQDFKINLIEQQKFEKIYGKNCWANCQYAYSNKKSVFIVNYSLEKIQRVLKSKDNYELWDGFHIIYHELAHAYQKILIHSDESFKRYTLEQYLLAIEDVYFQKLLIKEDKKEFKDFYNKNYLNLYCELDAEKRAIDYFINFFEIYNKKFLLEQDIKIGVDKLKNEYIGKTLKPSINNILYQNKKLEELLPKNKILLKHYPILCIAFNEFGLKKSKKALIEEKNKKIVKREEREEIDKLYNFIINIDKIEDSFNLI